MQAALSRVSGSDQGAGPSLTEDDAIELVQAAVRSRRYYSDQRCLSYSPEGSDATGFDVAVREAHGDGCPGDPDVAPIRDRFRVDSNRGVLRYDVASNTYEVFQR